MNIALLGYDLEGHAAYDYYRAQGHTLSIRDRNPDLGVPSDCEQVLGDGYLDNLASFDVLVRTAGLHPRLILEKNPDVASKITTNLNEFLQVCPTKNVIGITGTKGKGTTSTLVANMLSAAGKTVHLGGNIGLAPLRLLEQAIQADDWVVLEMSSFQLIDVQHSPHIAACLMVVPEHLDWHADLEEYLTAKQQLFRWQTADDIAVYNPDNDFSQRISAVSAGQKIPYGQAPGAYIENDSIIIDDQTICATSDIKLLGAHNLQNVCAALTIVWQITQDLPALKQVLTSFSGLEHRLEFIREVDSVKYYDDSFGTTPETAIVALQAFSEPKVIILGGSDKGASYDQLAAAVKNNKVRKVVLIGEQAGRIQTALQTAGFNDFVAGGDTMSQIVATLQAQAQPGDVALLSTGCASFGLFQNYKDRGQQFKAAVAQL